MNRLTYSGLLLFFTLTFTVAISEAETLSLYCVIDGESKGEVYKVDIEKRIVILDDVFELTIVHLDPNYVTAINKTDAPGGWMWTLDRNTGEFASAMVGFKRLKQQGNVVKKLGVDSYKGTCTKKLL